MDEDMNKKMEGLQKPIEDMRKAANPLAEAEAIFKHDDDINEAANPSGYVDPLADAKEILDREAAFEKMMNPTGAKSPEEFSIPQPPVLLNWVNCTHCGKDFEVKPHMLKPAPY